jgi:two-component system nitrogen regulation response regulator GlnG
VADIPLPIQVKLLRALEHNEALPVGSSRAVKTNFRVVSATHQDLLALVEQGKFRHDLYFRLAAFRVEIPPLRERREDILEIAEHFLAAASQGRQIIPSLSSEARAELERRAWHGNVRELRNAIERAVVVARGGVIDAEHLPPPAPPRWLTGGSSPQSIEATIAGLLSQWTQAKLAEPNGADNLYDQLLRLVEPPVLSLSLQKHRHQCASAARALGLHRTTLKKKLDQHGIEGGSSD